MSALIGVILIVLGGFIFTQSMVADRGLARGLLLLGCALIVVQLSSCLGIF